MFYEFMVKALDSYVDFMWFPLTWLILPPLLWKISFITLKRRMNRHIVVTSFFLAASILVFAFGITHTWAFHFDRNDYGETRGFLEVLSTLFSLALINVIMALPTSAVFIWLYVVGCDK